MFIRTLFLAKSYLKNTNIKQSLMRPKNYFEIAFNFSFQYPVLTSLFVCRLIRCPSFLM